MRVLHISAECYPAAKSGGLGDVAGALPKYLTSAGWESAVVIPKYGLPWTKKHRFKLIHVGAYFLNDQYHPYTIEEPLQTGLDFPLYVVNLPGLFDRPGIYGDAEKGWYTDNTERFTSFQIAILDWVKKHRSDYFTNKGYELVGIEMPLYVQASESNEHVYMNGFIDLVLRDIEEDRIIIIDIKTSTKGWNQYAKADKIKTSQLVLYKSYFAKQYGFDEDKIDVKYFIVKRKLIDGFMYPQKRVQEFAPASGRITRKKLTTDIDTFVATCFNADGSYNTTAEYPAIGDKGLKNCKYCEFADKEELCPKANRIK